jgi:hypothetical protein
MNHEQERAAFETWARDSGNGGDLKYYAPRDQYLNLYTHGMWAAWKARGASGVPFSDLPQGSAPIVTVSRELLMSARRVADNDNVQSLVDAIDAALGVTRPDGPQPVAVVKQGAAYGSPEFRAKVKKVELLVDPSTLEHGTLLYAAGVMVDAATEPGPHIVPTTKVRVHLHKPCPFCPAGPDHYCGHLAAGVQGTHGGEHG